MKKLLLSFLLLGFIVGCQSQNTPLPATSVATSISTAIPNYPAPGATGYPSPKIQSNSSGYPAPAAKRSDQTAFQSYPAALEAAKKWNPKATLHQIPATYQMEMNLGHSPSGEGWFFMFKVENSPLEYYVYTSDAKVSGTTEAQPIIIGGKAPFEFQPLPELSKMLDSDKVLALYMQKDGKKYQADNPDAIFNFQLNYLVGSPYPSWLIFDASKPKDNTPLFKVNALTGEVLPTK